jgi:hypothetical protein
MGGRGLTAGVVTDARRDRGNSHREAHYIVNKTRRGDLAYFPCLIPTLRRSRPQHSLGRAPPGARHVGFLPMAP